VVDWGFWFVARFWLVARALLECSKWLLGCCWDIVGGFLVVAMFLWLVAKALLDCYKWLLGRCWDILSGCSGFFQVIASVFWGGY